MNSVNLNFGLKGRFKLVAHKVDGDGNIVSTRELTPWFDNLITDFGLDYIGMTKSGNHINGCSVGSGNTPPANSDTALVTPVATTTTVSSNWNGIAYTTASPYYIEYKITFRFNTGTAAGNLSEVGIVSNATTPNKLFSRALILDGSGNPTTITVLSDEILDVTYALRTYLPNGGADVTGTFSQTIDGVATTFNYTLRAASFTSPGTSNITNWNIRPIAYNSNPVPTFFGGNYTLGGICNYDLGVISTTPSGTGSDSSWSSASALTYTSGNYYIDWVHNVGLASTPLTFKTYLFCSTGFCSFQMGITPSITKDTTKIYTVTLRISWSRQP